MNHRKRGGGKVIIKVRAVIFFSQKQRLLGNVQHCWCLYTTAGTSRVSRDQTCSVRSHTWEKDDGGEFGNRLDCLAGLLCNLQSATGVKYCGHIVSWCQRVQNYHLCGAVPVYPKWTTQCHIFPISIIACLHF